MSEESRFSEAAKRASGPLILFSRDYEILPSASKSIKSRPLNSSDYCVVVYCPNEDCDARSSTVNMQYPLERPSELRRDFYCPACGSMTEIIGYEVVSEDAYVAEQLVRAVGLDEIERSYLAKIARASKN
jgi:hypothetical protein